MKKIAYFIVILFLFAGGYYFYSGKNRPAVAPTIEEGDLKEIKKDSNDQPSPKPSPTLAPAALPAAAPAPSQTSAQGTYSAGEEGMAPDLLVVQINYDGAAYAPKSAEIKAGDIVIFKNNSKGQMWPASAFHPTHLEYPEFDAKQPVAAGGKWQFKFEKAGSWKYHDHLNPGATGMINVVNR